MFLLPRVSKRFVLGEVSRHDRLLSGKASSMIVGFVFVYLFKAGRGKWMVKPCLNSKFFVGSPTHDWKKPT